jgi:chloramphenicol-sensitive protein RarD
VLVVLHGRGDGTFGHVSALHTGLLVFSGIATAVPLLLFAAAARRIPLSTVGLLQYLTPTMHLAIGVFIYREPMPAARLAGFVLVWIALVAFTLDSLRHARTVGRRAVEQPVPAGL